MRCVWFLWKIKQFLSYLANRIYTKAYRDLFNQIATEHNEAIKEGVYTSLSGPSYETVTEIRGLAKLGADCVGASTAHEVNLIRI